MSQTKKLRQLIQSGKTIVAPGVFDGLSAAITRANAYREAGADMIFVEAPESVEQIKLIAQQVPGLKLLNMFHSGKTPIVPLDQLTQWGYQLVIVPSDLQRAAIKAMRTTLQALKKDGHSETLADQMVSFKERELIVETQKYLQID